MTLDRTTLVQFSLCVKIGLVGEFWSFKSAKAICRSLLFNLRGPLFSISHYTEETMRVVAGCFSDILRISLMRYISQVRNCIVVSVAINMVNVIRWPYAMDIKPSQSVRPKQFSLHTDSLIAVTRVVPSNVANIDGIGSFHKPRKDACCLVVVKPFAQLLRGKIVSAHAVVLLKRWVGSGPYGLPSAGAALF